MRLGGWVRVNLVGGVRMSAPGGYEMYYNPCPVLIDVAKRVDCNSDVISVRDIDGPSMMKPQYMGSFKFHVEGRD